MRLREVVRTEGRCRQQNRPTTMETLQADVQMILSRSRVNRSLAADAGKVAQLTEQLRGGKRVRLGRAVYSLLV